MSRGTRWGAKTVWRLGPYFRRYAVSVSRDRSKGGWTSQGFKLGRLTANTTSGRWTYDTPGPGSAAGDLPAWLLRVLPAWLTKQPSRGDR